MNAMKTMLSVLVVLLAGVTGLALVFTDLFPVPPGGGRVMAGAAFYVAVGFLLARLNVGGRPLRWAATSAWGLMPFGLVGVWISMTDRVSGDWTLALLFLVGPLFAAGAGGALGASRRTGPAGRT